MPLLLRGISVVMVAGLGLLVVPTESSAQVFGVGPRFSFVSGELESDGRSRYSGGLLRLRTSDKSAIEVSFDYRNHLNESLNTRIKDFPIQASFLFYPIPRNLAPYFVGGIGWYRTDSRSGGRRWRDRVSDHTQDGIPRRSRHRHPDGQACCDTPGLPLHLHRVRR